MPDGYTLHLGDCLDVMPSIPTASVDAIICDPPYPCISRPYGRMTEADWHTMMRGVVAESRRVLKPSGSAVFILQPNSERVGRMRPWLWEFMAWTTREWNMVQDAYWWNTAAMPIGGAPRAGLMRGSIKPCVWLGEADCYRDQDSVLWDTAAANVAREKVSRARNLGRTISPSGVSINRSTCYESSKRRGGVTPFNVIPTTHGCGKSKNAAGSFGHGAGTPMILADWWVRYISPPGGTVLDPFVGSGTVALAALKRGRTAIGIERDAGYHAIASKRLAEAEGTMPLLVGSA